MEVDTRFLTHGIPTQITYHETVLSNFISGDLLQSRCDLTEDNSLDIKIVDSAGVSLWMQFNQFRDQGVQYRFDRRAFSTGELLNLVMLSPCLIDIVSRHCFVLLIEVCGYLKIRLPDSIILEIFELERVEHHVQDVKVIVVRRQAFV